MRSVKKYLILIVVLLVPVLTYLFLEGFGVNKYTIPRYYNDSTALVNKGCIGITIPHRVSFTKYPAIRGAGRGRIMVVQPALEECLDCPPNLDPLRRLMQRHPDIDLLSLYAVGITEVQQEQALGTGWFLKEIDFPGMINVMRCELMIQMPDSTSLKALRENAQLVLIDEQGFIRGYYNKNSREDIDRLITELTILKDEQE